MICFSLSIRSSKIDVYKRQKQLCFAVERVHVGRYLNILASGAVYHAEMCIRDRNGFPFCFGSYGVGGRSQPLYFKIEVPMPVPVARRQSDGAVPITS